jgi:hypothetical protein
MGTWAIGGGPKIRQWGGRGEPIGTKGQTLWYSRYSTIPLRMYVSVHTSIVVHFDVIFVTLTQVLVFWQCKIFH